ncbi:MAG TPA: amidohydrolase family protein [Acidimicrobiales bacterium]|nr:amidohydrolase family protein [Acidimicrobiales bacterium]
MASEWMLIHGGTVVRGDGSPPEATAVLVHGDRIAAVGEGATADAVPRGEPLKRLDATGRTVMPGLIDAHCHMTYGESLTSEEIDLYTSVESRTLIAAWNMQKVLRAGVTAISQPGGSFYIGVGLREGVRAGIVNGPRMWTAGRYITTSNGLSDPYPEAVGVPESGLGVLANTLAEMREQVRLQVKNGVDFIKLADSPYGQWQAFSDDELKSITDLTHQLRRKITIHARGSDEVRASVRAGVDWIMHGNHMSDDVIDELAASRIPLVPTLLLIANLADFAHVCGVPPRLRDGCRRVMEQSAPVLHKAHEAGVVFVAGTDSGFGVTPYGEWHARELQLLVEYAGLSPLEAITAGTKAAAPMAGLEGEAGELAPGMLADLIVVHGDPVADIGVLTDKRNIETVVLGGRVVEFPAELDAVHHTNESARTYSRRILTYRDVEESRGASEDRGTGDLPWTRQEGRELASELRAQEMGARIVAPG